MKWLRFWLSPLLLIVPIAGCGSGDSHPASQGGLPARPKIPHELSPAEAKQKLREAETKGPMGRGGAARGPHVSR